MQMHKLLGSVYISPSVRERGAQRVKEILEKGTPHHSPAYAKLCYEVGAPAPAGTNGLPHTPPPQKGGGRHMQAGNAYPLTIHSQPPHTAAGLQNMGNPISPPFSFPSFGSPISPPPRSAPGVASHSYMPRQASPFQPMFGGGESMNGRLSAQGYLSAQASPYTPYPPPLPAGQPTSSKPDLSPQHSAMMPSFGADPQHSTYADHYLQNVNAMQSM